MLKYVYRLNAVAAILITVICSGCMTTKTAENTARTTSSLVVEMTAQVKVTNESLNAARQKRSDYVIKTVPSLAEKVETRSNMERASISYDGFLAEYNSLKAKSDVRRRQYGTWQSEQIARMEAAKAAQVSDTELRKSLGETKAALDALAEPVPLDEYLKFIQATNEKLEELNNAEAAKLEKVETPDAT